MPAEWIISDHNSVIKLALTCISIDPQLRTSDVNIPGDITDALGKLGRVDKNSACDFVALVGFVTPAVIDVDILVAHIFEAQVTDQVGDGKEYFVVDVASVLVEPLIATFARIFEAIHETI